ncbi:MAG: hypothetical protein LBH43_07465 [Treponema sp.]|jgi:hypothetical protein|nr:hypothetical protein [Treponema sp.]
MDEYDNVIDWLLEDKNHAIAYRTRIELLNEKADKSKVIGWIKKFMPGNWQDTKGKWLTLYYTTIAESGLTQSDIKMNKAKIIKHCKENQFENCGCMDFMRLRALIMLGFYDELKEHIDYLKSCQLPDCGFLCLQRKEKINHIPKSCIKANNFALLFCAECKKRKIKTGIENKLINYFWNHNVFYKSTDLSTLVLGEREGWRTIDTFHPFEAMRVGLHNIIESFCAMGYGSDKKLIEAWNILYSKRDNKGKYILDGTLTKSYLPKESVGKFSKWVTFYALLAEKNKGIKQN